MAADDGQKNHSELILRVRTRLAPLSIPAYRRFWAGRVLSVTGTAMSPVALAFAVLHLDRSATDLSLVLIANVGAQVIFLLLGGALADRIPRGRVLIYGNAAAGCVQGVVAAVVLSGSAKLFELVALSFLGGTASAFISPAAQGTVARLVPGPMRRDANALLRMAFNVFKVAGPAVAGVVVATVGAGWAIAWDAATFFGAALIMTGLPAEDVVARSQRFTAGLVEGLWEFWARPWLRILVIQGAVGVLGWLVGFQLIGPVYASHSHGGSVAWGEISAGFAVGLLAGSLGALVWRPERVATVMAAGSTCMAVPLLAMAVAAPTFVVVLGTVVAGIGLDMSILAWSTYRQQAVPDELLARMNAVNTLVQLLPIPVGYAAAGPLADKFGVAPVLFAAAGLTVAAAGTPLVWREVRALRLETSAPTAPEAATAGSRQTAAPRR
ncbi:MFS family permease [Catenulispora sp. GAS73]|uniref:MFS transporter n=1 Tax=Catenulispora sp. GAS73 TaxID=3156269 RepID=UPI0035118E0C